MIKDQLRPFAVIAQPPVAALRPAAADLAATRRTSTERFEVLN